jgi:hypothetical protein
MVPPKYPEELGGSDRRDADLCELLETLREPTLDDSLREERLNEEKRLEEAAMAAAAAEAEEEEEANEVGDEIATDLYPEAQQEEAAQELWNTKETEPERPPYVAPSGHSKIGSMKGGYIEYPDPGFVCHPTCTKSRLGSACSATTEDTTCSTLLTIFSHESEPVVETFATKPPEEMNSEEKLAHYDNEEFKKFGSQEEKKK